MLRKLINVFTGNILDSILCNDAANRTAAFNSRGKDTKTALLNNVADITQFHAETGVRLIRTETLHGLGIGHARQRQRNINVQNFLEHVFHEALADLQDILYVNKRHF